MQEPIGFEGRPQLAARFRGAGRGRHLILNGHIDVVDAEPREWSSSDPMQATMGDGRVYGRGV
jgi:acetylornithine deacetylase